MYSREILYKVSKAFLLCTILEAEDTRHDNVSKALILQCSRMIATSFDQVVDAFSAKMAELKALTLLRLEGTASPFTISLHTLPHNSCPVLPAHFTDMQRLAGSSVDLFTDELSNLEVGVHLHNAYDTVHVSPSLVSPQRSLQES